MSEPSLSSLMEEEMFLLQEALPLVSSWRFQPILPLWCRCYISLIPYFPVYKSNWCIS